MIAGRVTQECLGGCDHSDGEHFAFDEGVEHGELGIHSDRYRGRGELEEAYESGRSTGLLNRKEAA